MYNWFVRSIEIPQPGERDFKYRLFEILPAALSWLILALPAILAIINPKAAAYFIIAFILVWFARAMGLNARLLQGHRLIERHKKLPWKKLNEDLEILEPHCPEAPAWHARNLDRVREHILHTRIKPSQVYHVLIVAAYNESRDVLEPTIQAIAGSEFDLKKVMLISAYEQRGGLDIAKTVRDLVAKYNKHFYHTEAIRHPQNIPGEEIGKGGNITFAGRVLQKFIEGKKIDPLHVLVTTLDSDNRPHPQYLGALTYTYCSTEEPLYASYQPIPMFLNNIWDAPAPMRVIATGNSLWNLVLSLRPHLLRNFSSHAQPMAALIDTDFWSTRTIVEDGHQFWRTWFRYDGKHNVYPVFVPIYQDAVLASTYRKTIKAQFKQVQRWAYGASDVAYVANLAFLRPNPVPLHKL